MRESCLPHPDRGAPQRGHLQGHRGHQPADGGPAADDKALGAALEEVNLADFCRSQQGTGNAAA